MKRYNHRLRRSEASEYLAERWGISRVPSTLARLACEGGGPQFERVGKIPYYRPDDLDDWVRSLLSEPLITTKEYAK